MHRCWLAETEPLTLNGIVLLSAEEGAHVARVLRMKTGEPVQLIAADRLYAGELVEVGEKAVTVKVLSELPSPESSVHVTLVQGLPKLDKLETIVQKATELGVWAVLPVEMERSVAKLEAKGEQKRERLNRIALEAAKQSGRAHVPDIYKACSFREALITLRNGAFNAVLVAWEEESALCLSRAIENLLAKQGNPSAIAVLIGPEGGISAKEIALLKDIGAECVTLGRRILRTETAGPCALAVILSAFGEL